MSFVNKYATTIIIIILIFGVSMFYYLRYRVAPDIEKGFITFNDSNGNKHELITYNSEYKIVVFAASWCRDCLEEVPALSQLQQQLANKNISYFMLSDEDSNKILKLQNKTSFKVFQLDKPLKEYGIFSIPTLYVLDKKGTILYSHVGNINKDFSKHFQKITEAIQ